MGEGIPFLDILLLAMVAGFILLRLRSVLGRRTGHEQKPRPGLGQQDGDNVIPLPDRQRRSEQVSDNVETSAAAAGLARIRQIDGSFDAAEFAEGARAAYEMIVKAFAAGDTATLRGLLASDVYADFEKVINGRKAAGEQQQTSLVAIRFSELSDADVKGSTAEVTVKFVSEIISVTRNAEGAVVAGDPSRIDTVTDIWTFARDLRSSDPNWTLIATSTGG